MSDWDCRSELVLKERRGVLSQAERMALDAHLSQCASCRLSRLVGREFEVGVNVEPGDGARIAALAARARHWAEGAAAPTRLQRRRVPARVLLIAAALGLAAAGASAAGGVLLFGTDDEATPPVAIGAPTPAREAPPPKRAPVKVASTEAPDSQSVEPAGAAPVAKAPPRAPLASASLLFQQASDARRSGDAAHAITLYRRLQSEFSSSAEASLSRVPLGGLLLDRGDAAGALAQFDRYLAGGGSPTLAPEALYGRGRALAKLGRADAERRTWRELLERFGKSPYAAHAGRRLEQLSTAGPAAP